jgi:Family of unknown function (DUF6527)
MKIRWRQWLRLDALSQWFHQWLSRQLPQWVSERLPDWLVRQPVHCIGFVEAADEIPEKLLRNTAIIVGTALRPKWIAFDCPCQSGHRIMLNLDRDRRPYWQISKVDGPLSLSPSVNYYDGRRRCHYFIKNGKVDWLEDSFGER